MSFSSFGLDPTLLAAIEAEGYSTPTPIQTQAIPVVMEGRDLFGLAQTGTGKTAAFALPILHRYHSEKKVAQQKRVRMPQRRGPRCLVLTPTRELALQVAESFSTYGKRTHLGVAVVFGGVGIAPQKEALRKRPEVLVATPGRLLDLMGQGDADLSDVDVFILDEADRMFDMGFIHDIRKVVAKLPTERQTLLFSATMPDEIARLASGILKSPARVEVSPVSHATETVSQSVYFVSPKQRIPLMRDLLEGNAVRRCIVFTRMKHVANRVAESLRKDGITAEAFHANKSQSARVRALTSFKNGDVRVLVATDIAARGLDVDDVEVVINYDLPEVPETYVHRIGRAGRAGKTGLAWNLCDAEQRELLEDIERVTKVVPELVKDHPHADVTTHGCIDTHLAFRARLAQGRAGARTSQPRGNAKPPTVRRQPEASRQDNRRQPRHDSRPKANEESRPQSRHDPRPPVKQAPHKSDVKRNPHPARHRDESSKRASMTPEAKATTAPQGRSPTREAVPPATAHAPAQGPSLRGFLKKLGFSKSRNASSRDEE